MDRPLGTHQMLKQITTPEKPSQKKSQRSSTPGKPNSIEKPRFMKEQWDQPEAWGRNGEEGSSSKEISRLSQCSLIYPRTSGENKKKKITSATQNTISQRSVSLNSYRVANKILIISSTRGESILLEFLVFLTYFLVLK